MGINESIIRYHMGKIGDPAVAAAIGGGQGHNQRDRYPDSGSCEDFAKHAQKEASTALQSVL